MKNNKELQSQEWYSALIKDCKSIITEAIFDSRWALVAGYWNLGRRIREDENLKWHGKESYTCLQDLANNLIVSTRTLHYALQFYDKYPDLDKLPEGKNIN